MTAIHCVVPVGFPANQSAGSDSDQEWDELRGGGDDRVSAVLLGTWRQWLDLKSACGRGFKRRCKGRDRRQIYGVK